MLLIKNVLLKEISYTIIILTYIIEFIITRKLVSVKTVCNVIRYKLA